MRSKTTLFERFFPKIEFTDTCWLWTGATMSNGYGLIWNTPGQAPRNLLAHRAAYALLVGLLPDGMDIDHLCSIRRCVNPDHLEPVTHAVNVSRGNTFVARNLAITHCPQGHAYSPDNTRRYANKRQCRECDLKAKSERYRRKRAAAR